VKEEKGGRKAQNLKLKRGLSKTKQPLKDKEVDERLAIREI
jgi:hypothetical protein